jgi:four helix bundle protein
MFNFERLDCWHNGIEFADLVYDITRSFPSEERFGLTNQMRCAAVSVSSNVAEGCSRASASDYARFVEIAAGSLFEVVSQAFIARKRGFLDEEGFRRIYTAGERLGRMLSGLRQSLLNTR